MRCLSLRLPFWAQNPSWGTFFVAAFQHVAPTKTTTSGSTYTRFTSPQVFPKCQHHSFWSIFDVTSPSYPGYIPKIKTAGKRCLHLLDKSNMFNIRTQASRLHSSLNQKCFKIPPSDLRSLGCARFETKQWVNEGSIVHDSSITAQGCTGRIKVVKGLTFINSPVTSESSMLHAWSTPIDHLQTKEITVEVETQNFFIYLLHGPPTSTNNPSPYKHQLNQDVFLNTDHLNPDTPFFFAICKNNAAFRIQLEPILMPQGVLPKMVVFLGISILRLN